jgi:fatty acid desaturase
VLNSPEPLHCGITFVTRDGLLKQLLDLRVFPKLFLKVEIRHATFFSATRDRTVIAFPCLVVLLFFSGIITVLFFVVFVVFVVLQVFFLLI